MVARAGDSGAPRRLMRAADMGTAAPRTLRCARARSAVAAAHAAGGRAACTPAACIVTAAKMAKNEAPRMQDSAQARPLRQYARCNELRSEERAQCA